MAGEWMTENWITGRQANEGFLGFKKGGKVPGKGPKVAVVHGGETIVPAGKTLTSVQSVKPEGKDKSVPKHGPFRHFKAMGEPCGHED